MKVKKIANEIVRGPEDHHTLRWRALREDSFFWRFKPVSSAANCAQIPGMFRVNLNFGAQFSHINIHRTRAYKGGFPPNGIKYLITGKDAAGMLREIVQKPELCCRGRNDGATDCEESSPWRQFPDRLSESRWEPAALHNGARLP